MVFMKVLTVMTNGVIDEVEWVLSGINRVDLICGILQ